MTEWRPAAAVALLRRSASGETQVFLIERAPTLSYLAGFHALPGGGSEPADDRVVVDGGGAAAAAIATAARELFEELGVLVARGAERFDAGTAEAWRQRIVADAALWPTLLAAQGLELHASDWTELAELETPPYLPLRYRARYLAVWLPDGQSPSPRSAEIESGLWLTPREALARHLRGELGLTFPVLATLRALAEGGDLSAASARLRQSLEPRFPGGEMLAGVHLLCLRAQTLPPATHTNTYLLGGRELVVVDPGSPEPEEEERLVAYIERLTREGGRVTAIWLSHHHPDHVGGVEALRRRLGVPVCAHAATAAILHGRVTVDRLLADGDAFTTALAPGVDVHWRAVHTPGHAPGHLCFVEGQRRILLTGDNALTSSTVVIAPPRGDMAQYLESLARMLALEARFALPSHGPPTGNAAALLRSTLEHRRAREQAILTALETPRTVAELLAVVYADVATELWPFAAKSLQAHLDKLANEQRIELRDERWRHGAPR